MTQNTISLPGPVALVVQKVIWGRKGAPDTYKYDFVLCDPTLRPCKLYTADQMHAHAAKVCAEKDAEIVNLHTVMMAAAVEITEHWDAHCDGEGYGPANLVRRLENGFPEQYGYDAQTLVRVEKQLAERYSEIEQIEATARIRRVRNEVLEAELATLRTAAQQALEAIASLSGMGLTDKAVIAITTLTAALESKT